MSLVVCAIAKNEEQNLPDYVDSVSKFADQIIIVDNNSEDDTYSLAKNLGCTVVKNNTSQFDIIRNDYLSMTKGSWVLSLDLDEKILSNNGLQLKAELSEYDKRLVGGVYLPHLQYFGNGRWATFIMCRLYKNIGNLSYSREIHGSTYKSVLGNGYNLIFSPHIPVHHFDGLNDAEHNMEKRRRNINKLKLQMVNPSASIYGFLASEYYAIKEYDKAVELLNRAILLDNDSHSYARLFLSQVLFNCNKLEESSVAAQDAIRAANEKIEKKDPRSCVSHYIIDAASVVAANCAYKAGSIMSARNIIKESLEKQPFLPHNYINLFYFNQDRILLEKAIKLNPYLTDAKIYKQDAEGNIYQLQDSIMAHINVKTAIGEFINNNVPGCMI